MDAVQQAAKWAGEVDPPITADQVFQVLGLYEMQRPKTADGLIAAGVAALRERLVTAACELEAFDNADGQTSFAVRVAKAEGVRLALSYLDEHLREG